MLPRALDNPFAGGAVASSVQFPDGSAAAPSVTNEGDTDNGFYFPDTDQVALATGGVEAWRTDASQRLIVGHTASISTTGLEPLLQIHGTANTASVAMTRWSNSSTAPTGIVLSKSRGGSVGTNAAVQDGDFIGFLSFAADDGTDLSTLGAAVRAFINGTPAANRIPTDLVLYTAAGDSDNDVAEAFRLTKHKDGVLQGSLFIGDTANTNMTVGLTINTGAADNQALALKSSDVATGFLSVGSVATETDDWLVIAKRNASQGGATIQSICEDDTETSPFAILSYGGTANTNKTVGSSIGLINLYVSEHDGADALVDITADGNVFAVRARVGGINVTRVLVDEDGDLYSVTAAQTFDGYDDGMLLEAFDQAVAPDAVIRDEFASFCRYNEADLIRAKVLGAPVAEGGMWNITQHMRLLNGGVRQVNRKVYALEQALAVRDTQIETLTAQLAFVTERITFAEP